MSESEIEPSSQQAPFGAAGGTKYDTVSAVYEKRGPESTIGNIVNCSYDSVKLRIIHELCQGLGIGIDTFFASPLFQEDNLEP